jgi:hypothetical protein
MFYGTLEKNAEAFSIYGEVGSCPNNEVDIHLKDDSPFYIRPYPVSEENKPIIDKELDKLVKLGIHNKGILLTLVKKKASLEKRLCTDFRFLNSRVQCANQDFTPLKTILARIGRSNCKVLSVIDLKSALNCLPLSPRAQAYTGISAYSGGRTFYYRRLPMGLSISPSIFAQKINDILSKIPNTNLFCAVHDDVLIYSENKKQHTQHLQHIFQALIANGLKISPKKCRFFQTTVTYLGHCIVYFFRWLCSDLSNE